MVQSSLSLKRLTLIPLCYGVMWTHCLASSLLLFVVVVDASESATATNQDVSKKGGAFISSYRTAQRHYRQSQVQSVVAKPHHHATTKNRSKIGLTEREESDVDADVNMDVNMDVDMDLHKLKEPDERISNFGRQTYWNEFYQEENEFSWYSPWNDISPFFMELAPLQQSQSTFGYSPPRVLLPGIGNDSSMVDMYEDGYTHLTAFDYAQEGVECAKKFFGERVLQTNRNSSSSSSSSSSNSENENMVKGVELTIADARNLPYNSDSFDAVLEKGTLDAIYLSGGKDKDLASNHLNMAVGELTRVVCSGGVVMSITAACADAVEMAFASRSADWEVLRDGGFYMTEDGFSSNNIDATIFAWRKR